MKSKSLLTNNYTSKRKVGSDGTHTEKKSMRNERYYTIYSNNHIGAVIPKNGCIEGIESGEVTDCNKMQ